MTELPPDSRRPPPERPLSAEALRKDVLRVVQAGGSLHQFITALSAHAGSHIEGATVRGVLDDVGVLNGGVRRHRSIRRVVQALDSLWIQRTAAGPTVNVHLANDLTFTWQSGLGPVRVDLTSQLQLRVRASGSVTLRPGDATAHWMGFSEALDLTLRPAASTDKPPRDILSVQAGPALQRTVPVPPLVAAIAPPPTASTEPPATGGRSCAPEAPSAPAPAVVPAHTVPGRVRFAVQGLYRAPRRRQQLEQQLMQDARIERVSASTRTGRLLVVYDAGDLDAASIQKLVLHILENGSLSPQGTHRERPMWWQMPQEDILAHFDTARGAGLPPDTVRARRRRVGPNTLPGPSRRSAWDILTDQLKTLPVALLTGSALLSLFTGGLADAAIIMGVIGVNAGVGFVTEHETASTLAALRERPDPPARVVRNGVTREISGANLVPGDVILVDRGTYVPADARLLTADQLTVDESSLTGESVAVPKQSDVVERSDVPLGARRNMLFRGTVVTGGSARAVVVATGTRTEVGQVQHMITTLHREKTPLQRQLDALSTQLVAVTGLISGGVFVIGLLWGYRPLRMLKSAISLAVAAVPEGLPTVATTTLAVGVRKLGRQKIRVRRLDALETIGALQELCLDKTGTITRNEMTTVAATTGGQRFQVVDGSFEHEGTPASDAASDVLRDLLTIAVLCSDVEVTPRTGALQGSPTESAIARAARDAGLDLPALRDAHPRRRIRRRSEARIFMETLHDGPDGPLLAVKGQPDEVLALCNRWRNEGAVAPLTDANRTAIDAVNERLAGEALRVLGVAYAPHDSTPEENRDLIWLGHVGIADPPRPGMKAVMERFHRAGIATRIVTGDQSTTAQAIAQKVGISAAPGRLELLDATRLDTLPPDVLRGVVPRIDVFSRVSPAHKLEIVQALQQADRVVGMTGDGVNDGPALRAADIGIAMGAEGSDVAQDVADIVIEDDDLERILLALEEGRTLYADIKKAVHFIVASNAGEVFLTASMLGLGFGDPLSPMQLLWINLVTDIFPELALGIDPPEGDVLEESPRDPEAPMFSPDDLRAIRTEGVIITSGAVGAFAAGLLRYGRSPQAGTMAFTALTASQLLHAFTCRSEKHSLFDDHLDDHLPPSNPYVPLAVGGGLAAQVAIPFIPGLRSALSFAPLRLSDWLITGLSAGGAFFTNELLKAYRMRPSSTTN